MFLQTCADGIHIHCLSSSHCNMSDTALLLQVARSNFHLLGRVHPGQKPDFPCLLLAHEASHLGGPIAGIKAAHLGPCLPKNCIVRRYLREGIQRCQPGTLSYAQACHVIRTCRLCEKQVVQNMQHSWSFVAL